MENLTKGEEIDFMARIRSIKPDFWTDEKIVELSPLARLLFIGMWNFVDDYGRAEYSPLRLKMQILPADTADISEILGEIRGKKLIYVYEVENKEYFEVTGFTKHQKIDKRTSSKIPNPPPLSTSSPESPRIPSAEVEVEVEVEVEREKERKKKKENTLRDSDESTPLSLKRWFDEVMWPAVPTHKKNAKEKTWEQVQKLKPDEDTRKEIVTYLSSYYKIKSTYDAAGEFKAEMADPVRVIRDKRFKDVLVPFKGKTKAGGMAPTSAEKNGEEYDRLGYLRFMSDKMKRFKLKMEGESFRRDLIEIGDDPAKYEGGEDAEH